MSALREKLEKYPNGVSIRYFFNDTTCLREGPFKLYKDDFLEMEGSYKNGREHGLLRHHHLTGETVWQAWKNGKDISNEVRADLKCSIRKMTEEDIFYIKVKHGIDLSR